jgi:type I restriction enzyme, S subunit
MIQRLPLGQIITQAKLERAGPRELPILSMTMHDGLVDQHAKFKKRIASASTSDYKVVRRGQLVVGFPIDEGVLSFQRAYDAAVVSPAYKVWNLATTEVDGRYLERYLRSPDAIQFYRTKLRGTTARRRGLSDDIFLSHVVPLPDVAAQRRIADLLDKADALRMNRRFAIEKLDTLPQSIFGDMVGEVANMRLRWPSYRLADLAIEVRNGLSPSKTGAIKGAVLTLSAITQGRFLPSEVKMASFGNAPRPNQFVNRNDFFICRGNGSADLVGAGRYATEDMPGVVFPDTMIAYRLNSELVDRSYLESIWNSPLVRSQIGAVARTTNGTYKVNQETVGGIELPLPPIELQRSFNEMVERIHRIRRAMEGSSRQLDELVSSLQHRAFRGEL